MVHRRRVNDPEARKPDAHRFIEELKAQHAFYATPPGSNDDWWVRSGGVGGVRSGGWEVRGVGGHLAR